MKSWKEKQMPVSQDGKTQNFNDSSSPPINQAIQCSPKLKGLFCGT